MADQDYTVSITFIPQSFTVSAGSVSEAELKAVELAGDPVRIVSTHAWGA